MKTITMKALRRVWERTENERDTALAQYAEYVREKWVKPFCDKNNLVFMAGNGTWAFFHTTKKGVDSLVSRHGLPERLLAVLERMMDQTRNEVGCYVNDYPTPPHREEDFYVGKVSEPEPSKAEVVDFSFPAYVAMPEGEKDVHYPSCKVLVVSTEEGGANESLWGRKVDTSLVMLNNHPLDPGYRYGDVVRIGKDGRTVVEVVKRHFTKKYGFHYACKEVEAEDRAVRQAISERWRSVATQADLEAWFFWQGLGFITLSDAVDEAELVKALDYEGTPIVQLVRLNEKHDVEDVLIDRAAPEEA